MTRASSHPITLLLAATCSEMADLKISELEVFLCDRMKLLQLIFSASVLCSLRLVLNKGPVSPIYVFGQFLHGISYMVSAVWRASLIVWMNQDIAERAMGFHSSGVGMLFEHPGYSYRNAFHVGDDHKTFAFVFISLCLLSLGFRLTFCRFTLSMVHFGYPHCTRDCVIVFSSSTLSSSSVTMASFLSRRVLTTPSFWWRGWWESNCKYWLVCVGFLSSVYNFNLDLYTRTFLHFDHFMNDPDEPFSRRNNQSWLQCQGCKENTPGLPGDQSQRFKTCFLSEQFHFNRYGHCMEENETCWPLSVQTLKEFGRILPFFLFVFVFVYINDVNMHFTVARNWITESVSGTQGLLSRIQYS